MAVANFILLQQQPDFIILLTMNDNCESAFVIPFYIYQFK